MRVPCTKVRYNTNATHILVKMFVQKRSTEQRQREREKERKREREKERKREREKERKREREKERFIFKIYFLQKNSSIRVLEEFNNLI
jgi:hypothetical protein